MNTPLQPLSDADAEAELAAVEAVKTALKCCASIMAVAQLVAATSKTRGLIEERILLLTDMQSDFDGQAARIEEAHDAPMPERIGEHV